MIADPTDASRPQGVSPTTKIQDAGLARQLVEAAPDSMVIVDSAGAIILVNQRTDELFGYARDELLGRPVEVLMPTRFRERHIAHRAQYATDPHVRCMGGGLDLFGLHKDGVEFPVEIMISPIEFDGNLLVCAAIRDISERKIAEAERHANRLIMLRMLDAQTRQLAETSEQLHNAETMASFGMIATGLIHDLTNLLLPIRLRLNLLNKQCGKHSDHVQAIQRATDYMQELCRRFGRLMAGGGEPENEQAMTDLCQWWRDVTPLFASVLPQHVELKPDLPDGLPQVAVPRIELTQALFNLAHNACRAMGEQKSGSLKVCATASEDRSAVRLCVTDNGPGMTPDVKQRCFDPYFTTRKDDRGIGGMGLTLVKSIMARMHGSVEVESEPGRGTTFTLVLPAARSRAAHRGPERRVPASRDVATKPWMDTNQ